MTRESIDGLRDVKVYQNKGGYRFSVDALLLYSFVTLPRAKSIADLCAGSGIIGLLLARKYPESETLLVEVQESLASLAEKSRGLNGLEDRVRVLKADLREMGERLSAAHEALSKAISQVSPVPPDDNGYALMLDHFDLIVSNPPFRKPDTGKLSAGGEKSIARHEIMLPMDELVRAASLMLKHHGRFCLIHLPERLADIIATMRKYALEPKRLRSVHSHVSSEAKMILIEAVKGGKPGLTFENPLILYNEDGSYTDELKEMYGQ